ncbi:ABC transporter ATP-binding protein [Pseudonocardia sichuanensis]|uniref:Peptide/nickel transport system ATP-binding protein/oligopeptide transport system ATP-binding protein n=1 Tax=Pseudonocardia kunmingensis TaxID=630975 RepID=A0A543DZW3_9PSEU|nr:ABC transporter ATP-binding protein [Pseudonocardia kunmingensis]TQM14824.1 peptide/nickel transport system ATP-binding protein/oligopeptide transport system ATP-binding protein [Pseudonocardia kunmingensis]
MSTTVTNPPLLQVEDLHVTFDTPEGTVEAVSGVSFSVGAQETVAVVGESGSGKTVTALAVLQLLDGGRISGGRVLWDGEDLAALDRRALRRVRGNEIAMIFQDPMTSLDPLYSVGHQIVEALRLHRRISKRDARERAAELLEQVGMPDPRRRLAAYPHQLSGGQRQRVMIAIALACSPRLLIADEPTTALDVTIEAQILELLGDLQHEYRSAMLLVTHDMGVVAETADRVVVFYAGQVVEQGATADVLSDPQHPYTAALLDAMPTPGTDRAQPLAAIPGAVPPLRAMPAGCRFHTRCARAWDECGHTEPLLHELPGDRAARCLLHRPGQERPLRDALTTKGA